MFCCCRKTVQSEPASQLASVVCCNCPRQPQRASLTSRHTAQCSAASQSAPAISDCLYNGKDGRTDGRTNNIFYIILLLLTRLYFYSIHDFITIGITAFDTQVSTGHDRVRLTSLRVSQPLLKSPQLSRQHPPEIAQSPHFLAPKETNDI